jgi:colicin import membrane protein
VPESTAAAAETAAPAAEAPKPAAEATAAAPVVAEKTPEQKDTEARAAALARAKRESSRVQVERERLENERNAHAEDLKLAAEYRRLQKLQSTDPVAFAKEIGLSVPELAKKFVETTTGAKKTPAELVREEVDRRLAEEKKAREEAEKKAEAERLAQSQRQVIEGSKKQMAELVKANPERFELVESAGAGALDRAWKLVEDYYAETKRTTGTGQVLDFSKALDAIEADEEKFLARRLSGKKATSVAEKLKAEAAAKAKQDAEQKRKQELEEKQKRNLSSSGKSGSAGTGRVVEAEAQSPTTSNRKARGLSPTQIAGMAKDLWSQHQAKQDN